MWQADVVAMVADVMATGWMCLADVIAMVADVIATGHYFNFSSVLLTRTSSHIWGRWYLPMFLKNFVTDPYNEEFSETFKNICKRYGIQVHFKSGKTIKDELVAPKD